MTLRHDEAKVLESPRRPGGGMRVAAVSIAPAAAVSLLVCIGPGRAFAHGILRPDESPWAAWNLTPEITLGTLLVAGLYAAGLWRRRHKTVRVRAWRQVSFFAGLAAMELST